MKRGMNTALLTVSSNLDHRDLGHEKTVDLDNASGSNRNYHCFAVAAVVAMVFVIFAQPHLHSRTTRIRSDARVCPGG